LKNSGDFYKKFLNFETLIIHFFLFIYFSVVQIHVGKVNIDIKTQVSLILDLGILGHHQNIFFSYQV